MSILRKSSGNISNLKSARPLLPTFLVCAARALLYPSSLKFGGVWHKSQRRSPNIFRSEPISTILEHGFYVRAWRASTESSIEKWVMTIEVRLKIPWSMNSAQPDMFWRTHHTKSDPKSMRVMPLCLWGV